MSLAVRVMPVVIVGITALLPAIAMAQASKQIIYVVSGLGVIAMSGKGECVRTGFWTPALAAVTEAGKLCDPDLAPKPVAAAVTAVAPKPAAPKPASKPEPKAEPVKLLPQKINFSADALFDFDKSALKPEGKAMLDELTRVLQGAQYEVVLATGHADRIGPANYNRQLSLRRANAVKQYLGSKGIAAERVRAEGKGETQPLTKPGDCRGRKARALIDCLQPDRRVDVEVTATK